MSRVGWPKNLSILGFQLQSWISLLLWLALDFNVIPPPPSRNIFDYTRGKWECTVQCSVTLNSLIPLLCGAKKSLGLILSCIQIKNAPYLRFLYTLAFNFILLKPSRGKGGEEKKQNLMYSSLCKAFIRTSNHNYKHVTRAIQFNIYILMGTVDFIYFV